MNSISNTCFPDDVVQNLKDGTEDILFEKEHGKIIGTIIANMVNVTEVKDDYKFNLINTETSEILLKETGEPRAWYLKKALELGTIEISKSENLQLCPICKKNLILQTQEICPHCRREEKKNFFAKTVKMDGNAFLLDDEQTDAVLSQKHSIVTARAGSGKTRVLTAKLIDLFFNCGIKEDEVLAFCFNRDAAKEIRKRLNSECTINGKKLFHQYKVVTTFHSFAVNTIQQNLGEILTDDPIPNRTRLIKQIILNLRENNEQFEKLLRKYFLENTLKVDRNKFVSREHYYKFIRNSRYRTLNGEQVRSIPEKIIADFLFEHNIRYKYEHRFSLNNIDFDNHGLNRSEYEKFSLLPNGKRETIPDFYLEDYKFIWEHWGITGRETEKEKEEFSNEVCDYNEYKANMEWKRSFWNVWRWRLNTTIQYKRNFLDVAKLLETNPDVFNTEDRSEIERRLKKMLESHGVLCKKRSEEEIVADVWEKAEDYFTRQIRQFIDKFQQIYMDDEDKFKKTAKFIDSDQEKTFLYLGYFVYQEYKNILKGNSQGYEKYSGYKTDFNQCMNKASKAIASGIYDSKLKQLKWILIDEYQDFSELFFNLIQSIISRNPNIVLFCVGDDWQAINRFAGSDLKFFNNFDHYFADAQHYNINTNYRCENHIVSEAGDFMKRFGIPGKAQRGFLKDTGVFEELHIGNDKAKDFPEYEWLFTKKGPWETDEGIDTPYNNYVLSYIKTCSQIINENPGKKIMILNRTRKFLGKSLDEIARILKSSKLCKVESPNIDVKTVHQSKGEEADIVILTEVDENHFPILHPDTNLYSVFGENEYTMIEDEVRLYYVALTRAKHSMYILYSKDSPSCFIKKQPKKVSRKYRNKTSF